MYILKSDTNDAYFNLALEEYLLDNYNDDFFIIDVNEPSIILGVNQNAYEEINALYVKQSSIKVIRRLSGGGTIFQDYGNLNFSYIYKDDGTDLRDMGKVTKILAGFLREKLNIDFSFSKNNHLLISGKKFGGYTKLRVKDKILLHSSLVFSSNKKFLIDALKLGKAKHPDRALRSTHEQVTSISAHLEENISMDKFKDLFYNYILNVFPDVKEFELSETDKEGVNSLIKEKYSTWEWNYGNEIVHNYKNSFSSNAGKIEIYLQIEDQKIKHAYFRGDFFSQKSIAEMENLFTDCPYERTHVHNMVSKLNLADYIENLDKDEFVNHFFNNN